MEKTQTKKKKGKHIIKKPLVSIHFAPPGEAIVLDLN